MGILGETIKKVEGGITYINSDKMDLGMTVLARLGGGHVDDLARATLDHDVSNGGYEHSFRNISRVFRTVFRVKVSRKRKRHRQLKRRRERSAPAIIDKR